MMDIDVGLLDTQPRDVVPRGSRARPLVMIAAALFAVLASAAANHGDPVKGAARSDALFCGGCHGPGGRSVMPEYPSLAGQGAAYLEQQLRLFRTGERISQEMASIAASLTDDDIADLSAYYAAQSPRPAASPSPEPSAALDLYRNGEAARSIQACAACHGPDGRGDDTTMTPALRSLQAAYVRAQMEAYSRRSRYRSAVPDGLQRAGVEAMYDVTARLTEDEVRELAQYLQSLP